MSQKRAPQVIRITSTETRRPCLSFDNDLPGGVTIASVVTSSVSPTGPTLDNVAATTAAYTIGGDTCPTGRGVRFRFTGGTAGTTYTVFVRVTTSESPADTVDGSCTVVVGTP